MGILLFIGILYSVFIIYILTISVLTIIRGRKQPKTIFATVTLIIAEIIFTVVAPVIGFWRLDQFQPQIPFARHHILSIIILVIVSSVSFWLAKFTNKYYNLYLRILFSAGMLQGIILCTVTTIHFASFLHLGLFFPFVGFELLSPPIALFLLMKEFYFYNKIAVNSEHLLPYREQCGFIPLPIQIMKLTLFPRILVFLAVILFFLFAEVMIGFLLGQDIDSILKAFTHSVGFVFSKRF